MEDEARIVGGSEASEGQFPYQLSFQRFGSHFCGAEIYDEVSLSSKYQVHGWICPTTCQ